MSRTKVEKVVLLGTTAEGNRIKIEAPTQEMAIAGLRGAGCVSYRVTQAVALITEAPAVSAPKPPKSK